MSHFNSIKNFEKDAKKYINHPNTDNHYEMRNSLYDYIFEKYHYISTLCQKKEENKREKLSRDDLTYEINREIEKIYKNCLMQSISKSDENILERGKALETIKDLKESLKNPNHFQLEMAKKIAQEKGLSI